MEPEQRIFPIPGDRLVEFLVVLVLEFGLGAPPERAGGIDLFGRALLDRLLFGFVPLALVVGEEDRKGDVVGVLLDNLLQPPAIGVLFAFFVEVKKDSGAGDRALGGFDVETRLAVAGPAPGLSSPALRETTSTRSATMKQL